MRLPTSAADGQACGRRADRERSASDLQLLQRGGQQLRLQRALLRDLGRRPAGGVAGAVPVDCLLRQRRTWVGLRPQSLRQLPPGELTAYSIDVAISPDDHSGFKDTVISTSSLSRPVGVPHWQLASSPDVTS